MVKAFIKSFFFTDPTHFPLHTIDAFLPSDIQSLYFDYYMHGTGHVFLLTMVFFAMFHLLFSKKSRFISFIMIFLLTAIWPTTESIIIQNTTYMSNILGFPAIQLPEIILSVIIVAYVIFIQLFFFTHIRYQLSPKINLFLLISLCIANCMLFLPIFTGELWTP